MAHTGRRCHLKCRRLIALDGKTWVSVGLLAAAAVAVLRNNAVFVVQSPMPSEIQPCRLSCSRSRHFATECCAVRPRARKNGGVPGWLAELEEELGVESDPDMYDSLLAEAVARDDLSGAKSWFAQGVSAGMALNVDAVETFVLKLASNEGLTASHRWLNQSGADATKLLQHHVGVLNTLIRRSSGAGCPAAAEELEKGVAVGIKPDAETYRLLIQTAVKGGKVAWAVRWFMESVEAKLQSDVLTFNSILSLVTKADGHAKAQDFLQQASGAGVAPNLYTFQTMMVVALEEGSSEVAKGWLNECDKVGFSLNARMLNQLISVSAKKGKLDIAEEWYEKFKDQGVEPDVFTYNILMSAASKTGNLPAAERWFAKIAEEGYEYNVISFNTLIHAAMKRGRPQLVEDLFWEMQKKGIKPDDVTFRTMRWSLGQQKVSELSKEAGVGWYGKPEDDPAAAGSAESIGRFKRLTLG